MQALYKTRMIDICSGFLFLVYLILYSNMKHSIGPIFICPKCKSRLFLKIKEKTGDRIHSGKLFCKKCKKSFEIIDDIVCFKKVEKQNKKIKEIKEMRELFLGPEYNREWYKHFSKKDFLILKEEWKFMIENLNLNESKIHLDWATGTARFLRNILNKTKAEIIALDFGYPNCLGLKEFLKKIKRYSHVTIIYGDARNMFFSDDSIDSISSWHGLNEPDMFDAVNESKRILKKNKKIVVSGEFYEEGSGSLKLAKRAGIDFAEKDKTYNYFKKLGFKNIKYKKFSKTRETSRENFIPKHNEYHTVYGISAKK